MSKSTTAKPKRRQPSNDTMLRVYEAFDPAALVNCCLTDDFTNYATRVELPGGRFYWYQDNGADVLAVAHLDTVQGNVTCSITDTAAGPLVVSGALDDRLGAYVILDLLPALGVTCDWLLTTDEEIGRSTAADFAASYGSGLTEKAKQYHWLIEFDRGGTDVVMYQYETPDYADLVHEAGAQVGDGSYSDIASLEDLGCAAYNWGVGYQDYHGPRAHAWLADTFRSVARFLTFHDLNAGTFMPHEPRQTHDDWMFYDCEDPIEADCGHMVDLADDRTYYEYGTGGYIVCPTCRLAT